MGQPAACMIENNTRLPANKLNWIMAYQYEGPVFFASYSNSFQLSVRVELSPQKLWITL